MSREITKICCKCNKELPFTADYFYRDNHSSTGFTGTCKKCILELKKIKWKKKIENEKNIIKDLEGEIWKDIKDYEGLYKISNMGRVKSLYGRERILKQCIQRGYYCVKLSKNGSMKGFSVHRLVAEAFVFNLNEDKFKIVNHKDENKLNDKYYNLEWCDCKYNLNYGEAQKRRIEKQFNKIYQYDLSLNFIKLWNSAYEVKRELGYDNSLISKCCKGNIHKAYNFIWSYIKLYNEEI